MRDKAGVRPAPARPELDDPAGAFQWIRATVEEVLDDPNTATDVAEYLDAALSFDLPQHWWDLANAVADSAGDTRP